MKFGFLLLLGLLIVPTAYAQSMSNDEHTFQFSQDSAPTAAPVNTDTVPTRPLPHNPKVITGDNYIAYLSYDDDSDYRPLIITTSTDILNFGKIVPGEPLIRTQSIAVLPGTSHGFKVLSYEDHMLQADNQSIPDTSCDTGSCSDILPDLWVNPLTYGFGYRCDNVTGSACSKGFEKEEYKRFSNMAAGETPAPLLQSYSADKSQTVISFKLNISANQPSKGYQNTIYYITAPSL